MINKNHAEIINEYLTEIDPIIEKKLDRILEDLRDYRFYQNIKNYTRAEIDHPNNEICFPKRDETVFDLEKDFPKLS